MPIFLLKFGENMKAMHKKWINCAKFLAMAAVVTDHLCGIVYEDYNIRLVSYFSVSLFVLLSGVTAFYSLENHKGENIALYILRRELKIFLPYMAAVFVVMALLGYDLSGYFTTLFNFSASGAFYFIPFFMQLVCIAPLLFWGLEKIKNSGHANIFTVIFVAVVCIIGYILSVKCVVFNIYGGGGVILGGTYFSLFALGMLFTQNNFCVFEKRKNIFFWAFLAASIIFAYAIIKNSMFLDILLPTGLNVNPPGFTLCIFALSVFLCAFCGFGILQGEKSGFCVEFVGILDWFGGCTLYIFLFHSVIIELLQKYTNFEYGILKGIVFYGSAFLIPALINSAVNFVSEKIKKNYGN